MGRIGLQEVIVILLVVVVLFGARKIPDLMRSLGIGIREFKSGLHDEKRNDEGKSKSEKTDNEG